MQAIILYYFLSITGHVQEKEGKKRKGTANLLDQFWILQQTGLGEQGKNLQICRVLMRLDAVHGQIPDKVWSIFLQIDLFLAFRIVYSGIYN